MCQLGGQEKPGPAEAEVPPEQRTGDEVTRELEDAWNLYSRVGHPTLQS